MRPEGKVLGIKGRRRGAGTNGVHAVWHVTGLANKALPAGRVEVLGLVPEEVSGRSDVCASRVVTDRLRVWFLAGFSKENLSAKVNV